MRIKYLILLFSLFTTYSSAFSQQYQKNNSKKTILFDTDVPALEINKESLLKLPYVHSKDKNRDYFDIFLNKDEKRKYIVESSFTKNVFITDGLKNCKDCKIKFRGSETEFDSYDFYINYSNPIPLPKDNVKCKMRIIEPSINLETDRLIGVRGRDEFNFKGNSQLYDPIFGSKSAMIKLIASELEETAISPKIFKKGLKEVQASKFYVSLEPVINNFYFNLFEDNYRSVEQNPYKNSEVRFTGTGDLQISWKFMSPGGKLLFEIPTRVVASSYQNDGNEMFKALLHESMKSLLSVTDLYTKIEAENNKLEIQNSPKSIDIEKVVYEIKDTKSMLNKCREGVVTIFNPADHSFGSGFVISKDGYIVTNYHVIEDNEHIRVQFYGDTTKFEGTLLNVNEDIDVAILKVTRKDLMPLQIANSDEVDVGENVFAIGTPGDKKLSQSVTKGIISGKREMDEKNYFQTDVSINFGNSGGPLINDKGEVIGVVVMKMVGDGVEGLSFVIPSSIVTKTLKINYK